MITHSDQLALSFPLILCMRCCSRSWSLTGSLLLETCGYILDQVSCDIHTVRGKVLGLGRGIALYSALKRASALVPIAISDGFSGKRHQLPRYLLFYWRGCLIRHPRTMKWSELWWVSLTTTFKNIRCLVSRIYSALETTSWCRHTILHVQRYQCPHLGWKWVAIYFISSTTSITIKYLSISIPSGWYMLTLRSPTRISSRPSVQW